MKDRNHSSWVKAWRKIWKTAGTTVWEIISGTFFWPVGCRRLMSCVLSMNWTSANLPLPIIISYCPNEWFSQHSELSLAVILAPEWANIFRIPWNVPCALINLYAITPSSLPFLFTTKTKKHTTLVRLPSNETLHHWAVSAWHLQGLGDQPQLTAPGLAARFDSTLARRGPRSQTRKKASWNLRSCGSWQLWAPGASVCCWSIAWDESFGVQFWAKGCKRTQANWNWINSTQLEIWPQESAKRNPNGKSYIDRFPLFLPACVPLSCGEDLVPPAVALHLHQLSRGEENFHLGENLAMAKAPEERPVISKVAWHPETEKKKRRIRKNLITVGSNTVGSNKCRQVHLNYWIIGKEIRSHKNGTSSPCTTP